MKTLTTKLAKEDKESILESAMEELSGMMDKDANKDRIKEILNDLIALTSRVQRTTSEEELSELA